MTQDAMARVPDFRQKGVPRCEAAATPVTKDSSRLAA